MCSRPSCCRSESRFFREEVEILAYVLVVVNVGGTRLCHVVETFELGGYNLGEVAIYRDKSEIVD